MNAKLLAALATAAALILGAVLFLTGSDEPDQVASLDGPSTADGTVDGSAGGATELLELEARTSEGARSEAPATGLESGLPDAAMAAEPAAPGSTSVQVSIEWPAGSTPSEDLVVYAFPRRVQGASLARALTSDLASITIERYESGPMAEVNNDADSDKDLFASAYDSVPVSATSSNDASSWGATITLPRGIERAFFHAFGGGLGTEDPLEARAVDGAVLLRPSQLGSLVVNATTEVPGMSLEGSFTRLKVETGGAAMMSMGSSEQSRFRSDRGLGADGHTEFVGVPTGRALTVRLLHDRLAPLEAEVAALAPGEARQVTVELAEGLRVSGRVVDAEGKGMEGATVSASLPGQIFGFDDEIFRTTTSDLNGAFELEGLPSKTIVVRAARKGALQSERVQIDPATSSDTESLTLTLETGRSIEGKATFADGSPAAGVVVEASFDIAHMAGPAGLGMTRGATNEGVTNAEGEFTIGGLGSGPFRLKATSSSDGAGGESAVPHVARLDGVRPGSKDIQLTLRPTTAVVGRCVDDEGAPVVDEWIMLHRLVAGSMGDVRLDRQRGKTGEEGEFSFAGVTPGEWTINVASDRYVTPEEFTLE
ncbi:MAG: carboxypeptidase-like regulatory domain-containing protein, partial [Planctomycetota bacterium]